MHVTEYTHINVASRLGSLCTNPLILSTSFTEVQRILAAKTETSKKMPFNCSWSLSVIVALLEPTFN
jgi:hypothetical protein